MSDFVDQCRREWKRLGVADSLADEMAADLTADLSDAEAEGVSAEDVLGEDASDPRSFAAAWAVERGIIPERRRERGEGRTPLALVAFTVVAALTLIVAVLLLATGEPKLSVNASRTAATHLHPRPAGPTAPFHSHHVLASGAAPIEWLLLLLAIAALGFSTWLWLRWGSSRPHVRAASFGSAPRS